MNKVEKMESIIDTHNEEIKILSKRINKSGQPMAAKKAIVTQMKNLYKAINRISGRLEKYKKEHGIVDSKPAIKKPVKKRSAPKKAVKKTATKSRKKAVSSK